MPVEFSHYEARVGVGVVRSTYACIVRRITGRSARLVLVVKPDHDEPEPREGKASLFQRRKVRAA